jgi:hypothetical protein
MLQFGQQVAGTAATFICFMPSGPCRLTLVNTGGTTAAIGTSNTVTAGNGGLLPASGVITYAGSQGSTGSQVYAAASSGTVTVSYHLSTAS